MRTFECIVIGVGGMGSAVLYHLARRGVKALGIEQFDIAHNRGSSHGRTRIIRKSYFEHPDYVPLLNRAYDLWAELEQESGTALFERTGLLVIGAANGPVVRGVRCAAELHDLEIAEITLAELSQRFPGFRVGDEMAALFEPDAGYLKVEDCVRVSAQRGVALGATLITGQTVRGWTADATGVVVRTECETYHASRLVICGGAWSARLLADLGLPLEVRRKVMLWYQADALYLRTRGCPAFCFETGDGFFYGLPVLDDRGMKIAEHSGGEAVADPAKLDWDIREADRIRVEGFIAKHLPAASSILKHGCVCMYTMTPDEHFIVDRHVQHRHVVYAAGFSGHGFKFAPIVGSVLADLAMEGRTAEPIGFLSAGRAAIRRIP